MLFATLFASPGWEVQPRRKGRTARRLPTAVGQMHLHDDRERLMTKSKASDRLAWTLHALNFFSLA